MTFEELRLCMAIHRANLGGRDRTRKEDRHRAVGQVFWNWLHLFGDSRFPWAIDDVLHWSMQYRKSKSSRMKVQIALAHGDTCYFKNRGKGPCCGDAEWGHIKPRCRGGSDTVENGQIECRAHNHQRGVNGNVMTIEEYLDSPLTTHRDATLV
jgi:hypothetical protein